MRDGLTMVQDIIQTLVETLVSYGVVCKRAADGELLLELYSLLECLQPAEHDLPERLRQLRFVPTRTTALGLYLVYEQLPLYSRRNLRPMKLIYWSLLMSHEHAARSLVELMQIGETPSGPNPVLHHAPEAFNRIEVVAAPGR